MKTAFIHIEDLLKNKNFDVAIDYEEELDDSQIIQLALKENKITESESKNIAGIEREGDPPRLIQETNNYWLEDE